MTRTRTTTAGLAVALVLVAAGCGSSGGSDSSGSDGGGSSKATTTAADTGSSSDLPVALTGKVNDEGSKDISGDGDTVDLSMELDDNYFSPTFIKAAPGATVTVELENEGSNPHTFTLDDGSIDQQVAPGEKASVTVTVPEDGSLRFSCDFHGDMGMQGAFYTGDGSASSVGATTTTAASSGGSDSGY